MLEDLKPPVKVMPCAVRTLLNQLSSSDQEILEGALSNPEVWGNTALARELSKRGLIISEKPIRKHRAGLCSCALGFLNA